MDKKKAVHISAKGQNSGSVIKELFSCRDMIGFFVKRNITASYQQTILGPLWIIIGPLLSTVVYNIVFTDIAGIDTDGAPSFLFYLCGNLIWSFFAGVLSANSSVLTSNAGLFSKVYFPRLAVPVSTVLTRLIHFGIQFVMFLGFLIYYIAAGYNVHPNLYLLLVPVLIIEASLLATGVGLILSAATAKYRDLRSLIGVLTHLWMFATPVVYPVSASNGVIKTLLLLNPMTPIVETFRYAFTGRGGINVYSLLLSFAVTLCVLLIGIALFRRTERNYLDTV